MDVVDDVRAIGAGRRVSSTWIRELLAEGDVETAAKLLGRPASVWGEVVHGLKRGRELGFPTANLSADLEGFVPADGVYAGWLSTRGPPTVSVRACAIRRRSRSGTNPTFDDVEVRQVEAYVLDETDLDLYGHRVEVQFVRRIRGMVAFEGSRRSIGRSPTTCAACGQLSPRTRRPAAARAPTIKPWTP